MIVKYFIYLSVSNSFHLIFLSGMLLTKVLFYNFQNIRF